MKQQLYLDPWTESSIGQEFMVNGVEVVEAGPSRRAQDSLAAEMDVINAIRQRFGLHPLWSKGFETGCCKVWFS